jgi:hypothetical protein
MNLVRKLVGLGAVVAVTLGLFAASAGSAHAQGPFTAYGIGQSAGSTVTASIEGVACGSTTVDGDGNWLLAIEQTAPCNPVDGDTINFALNGATVSQTATWTPGGSPATSGYDPNVGIPLSGAAPSGGGGAPGAAETGNAGLVYAGDATSTALWLALLALAGLSVAGTRVATRER